MTKQELIAELEAWWDMDTIDHVEWENCFKRILSRAKSEPEQEPLAVLADRKGYWKTTCIDSLDAMANRYITITIERTCHDPWSDVPRDENFTASTYAEAESKCRAYLNTLPDVKQEGTR